MVYKVRGSCFPFSFAYKENIRESSERERFLLRNERLLIVSLFLSLMILRMHFSILCTMVFIGTHLYVLYEGYGYSVASLYCLGFVSGALTSPFTGPFVDRVGRRKSAIVYCILEIFINMLEQRDSFTGLIMSRVVGGITTNLLFTVFESWLVTEHRHNGFSEESLEVILRDSVICSNLSAIASGILAHYLAHFLGPVGPFEGAVGCTWIALVLVFACWGENYGSADPAGVKSVKNYMRKSDLHVFFFFPKKCVMPHI